jgi:hypothetical protein
MRGWKALGLTLAMSAGLVAAAIGLRGTYARWAAAHWRSQLAAAADDRAGPLLRRAAELGEPGMALLAESLGSPRRGVALAARQVLTDRLTAWQDFSEPGGWELQLALAEALADRVEQFGPAARSEAAELAERILASLPGADGSDGLRDCGRLLVACEKVLRAAPERREYFAEREAADAAEPGEAPRGAPGATRTAAADAPPSALRDPLGPETSLPGLVSRAAGSGPVDPPTAAAPVPAVGENSPPAGSSGGTPGALANLPGARPISSVERPPRPLSGSDEARAIPQAGARAGRPSSATAAVKSLSLSDNASVSSPAKKSAVQADVRGADVVTLMRRLQAANPAEATQSRDELLRRGMTEVQLDLARRLFDPDAKVRKQLARALPGLQSIDGVPWLLQLARDEEADVRLVAITLLATTGNPALLAEVEAIAQEDTDPRIQQQAERLTQLRNEKKPATWKR